MATPLTRRQLDRMECSIPNCGHDHSKLVMGGKCHPRAYAYATYVKKTGTLELRCTECGKPVAVVLVASGDPI